MEDFQRTLPSKLDLIESTLKLWPNKQNIESKGNTGAAIQIRLRPETVSNFIDVDILPAYDNLSVSKY